MAPGYETLLASFRQLQQENKKLKQDNEKLTRVASAMKHAAKSLDRYADTVDRCIAKKRRVVPAEQAAESQPSTPSPVVVPREMLALCDAANSDAFTVEPVPVQPAGSASSASSGIGAAVPVEAVEAADEAAVDVSPAADAA